MRDNNSLRVAAAIRPMRRLLWPSFRRAFGLLAALFFGVGCLMLTALPLKAQDLTGQFGGFSKSSNAPIHIEADELKVNDIKKTATFVGNVRARQGDFEIRSRVLEVLYSGAPQAAGRGASGKVRQLVARGKVLISTKDDQSATSDWANFDVLKQVITLGDKVVLTQKGNVVSGGKLQIDLKTRQSRFVNKQAKDRIRMKIEVNPAGKKK